MALIYTQSAPDKVLTLAIREAFIYPFVSPNWKDLRLGFYASLTNPTADDVHTALTEALPKVDYSDRYFFGFKNNSNDTRPVAAGTSFAGIMNESGGNITANSVVDPSNDNSTTTGTKYWRARATAGPEMYKIDGVTKTEGSTFLGGGGGGMLFPQDVAAAGGYSVLNIVKLTRPTTTSTSISINNQTGASVNVNFSSAPTVANIRTLLASSSYTMSSGTTLTTVPDALYFYWPFLNSRLRILAIALEKFA
jgi:hypothetical protein